MKQSKRLRLAFAAVWSNDRTTTWSGTPFSLLSALQQRKDIDVLDTPVRANRLRVAAARWTYLRRVRGKWVSQYRIAPPVVRLEQHGLERVLRGQNADVALLIGDIGVPPTQFMTYSDHTFLHFADNLKSGDYNVDRLYAYKEKLLQRRIEQQTTNLQKSSALVTMSEWDASFLKSTGKFDPNRIFVVPPGRNAAGTRAAFEDKTEHRLLFVGSDFNTKAGSQVVRAFQHLRANVDYDVTLVIAGPKRWPMQGPIPEGVEFLGTIPFARVHQEMRRSCGFVMPSIFEAYGIVFLEALGEGIPVIGRKACAMPEFITQGENGFLIERFDYGEEALAGYMNQLCTDLELRKRVYDMADEIAYQVSWQRTADEMVRIANLCLEMGDPRG